MADIAQVDINEKTGFLLAEESALKEYLSGIQLPSRQSVSRSVAVYFRWPSTERSIKYPYMTLDLLSITPAYDLWHSEVNVMRTPAEFVDQETGAIRKGMYYPSVSSDILPDGVDIEDYNGRMGRYLPYRLMFQITTYTNSAIDDRVLQGKLLIDKLSPRSFFIGVDADSVWRRCELLEWVGADTQETTENSNRIFRKMYTISMETEIPTTALIDLEAVERVHVDIYSNTGTAEETKLSSNYLPPEHDYDDPNHDLITGSFNNEAPPSGP